MITEQISGLRNQAPTLRTIEPVSAREENVRDQFFGELVKLITFSLKGLDKLKST